VSMIDSLLSVADATTLAVLVTMMAFLFHPPLDAAGLDVGLLQ
jgi:hypothetical protein